MQAAARLRIAAGNGVPHINAPTDLSGLVGWWDASAITGHVNGDKLASWTDSSAVSGAVVQATGTKQPTYNTGIQNGLPVVTFAGAQTMAVAGTSRSAPYTVFQVMKVTTPGATTQIGFDGATTARASMYCSAGKVEMYEGTNNDASTVHGAAAPVSFPTGATLLAGVFPGVASGISTDQGAICRVNRTSYFVNGPIGTQALVPITLGSANGGASFFLTGWVAETVVYSRALSLTEVQSVENYLRSKWATT